MCDGPLSALYEEYVHTQKAAEQMSSARLCSLEGKMAMARRKLEVLK